MILTSFPELCRSSDFDVIYGFCLQEGKCHVYVGGGLKCCRKLTKQLNGINDKGTTMTNQRAYINIPGSSEEMTEKPEA